MDAFYEGLIDDVSHFKPDLVKRTCKTIKGVVISFKGVTSQEDVTYQSLVLVKQVATKVLHGYEQRLFALEVFKVHLLLDNPWVDLNVIDEVVYLIVVLAVGAASINSED